MSPLAPPPYQAAIAPFGEKILPFEWDDDNIQPLETEKNEEDLPIFVPEYDLKQGKHSVLSTLVSTKTAYEAPPSITVTPATPNPRRRSSLMDYLPSLPKYAPFVSTSPFYVPRPKSSYNLPPDPRAKLQYQKASRYNNYNFDHYQNFPVLANTLEGDKSGVPAWLLLIPAVLLGVHFGMQYITEKMVNGEWEESGFGLMGW